MACSIADIPAMDALVEGPVNRYTTTLDAGIRQLQNGGYPVRNRGRHIAGLGPYEWVVVGFFAGLLLPSVMLRYLGAGEAAQVSAGDRSLLLGCVSAYQV